MSVAPEPRLLSLEAGRAAARSPSCCTTSTTRCCTMPGRAHRRCLRVGQHGRGLLLRAERPHHGAGASWRPGPPGDNGAFRPTPPAAGGAVPLDHAARPVGAAPPGARDRAHPALRRRRVAGCRPAAVSGCHHARPDLDAEMRAAVLCPVRSHHRAAADRSAGYAGVAGGVRRQCRRRARHRLLRRLPVRRARPRLRHRHAGRAGVHAPAPQPGHGARLRRGGGRHDGRPGLAGVADRA